MRVMIKKGLESHYYAKSTFTKGKVYETVKEDGKDVVYNNTGVVAISISYFNPYRSINTIGGEAV